MATVIYHNPRCAKSRETLKLLIDRGMEPRVVEYLKTPPDAATLEHLLDLLGVEPRGLMRRKEKAYRSLGLDDPARSRDELIQAMVAHPELMERPVVVSNGRAVIGRPPAIVLSLT